MTDNTKARERLIADLRDRISQTISIPAEKVENSKDFWEFFSERKLTTDFVNYVAHEYKVYLTPDEWNTTSTLDKLADHILEKQANPQPMLFQIRVEKVDLKKRFKIAIPVSAVSIATPFILSIIFDTTDFDQKLYRLLLMAGLIILAEIRLFYKFSKESKTFNYEVAPILQRYNYDPEENYDPSATGR